MSSNLFEFIRKLHCFPSSETSLKVWLNSLVSGIIGTLRGLSAHYAKFMVTDEENSADNNTGICFKRNLHVVVIIHAI